MRNAGALSWKSRSMRQVYTGLGVAPSEACIVATPARTQPSLSMFADDDFTPEMAQTNGSTQRATPPGPVMESHDFDVNLLALASINGIGHKTLRKLVDHFGDLERIWQEDTPIVRDLLAEAHV